MHADPLERVSSGCSPNRASQSFDSHHAHSTTHFEALPNGRPEDIELRELLHPGPHHSREFEDSSSGIDSYSGDSAEETDGQEAPSNTKQSSESANESHQTRAHMNRKKSRTGLTQQARSPPVSEGGREQNGDMEKPRSHRRKFSIADGSTSSHFVHASSSEAFDSDRDLPGSLVHDDTRSTGTGFASLPEKDRNNFLLLVLLYFLQGIPMGLAGGSVPFLLKSHLSYGQIGIFSLAIYPYSLKLLWSPIVDAVWSPKVGRRKSWILPIQALSGLGMVWLGGHAEVMMTAAGADSGSGVWGFTAWWFFLVFTCATQDIAVDGWAITLLSQRNIAYASTAQTVGLTGGQFLSYTVFLAFNSPDFANKWFRAVPSPEGVMTLGGYLTFWGWMYLVVTAGLAIFKREDKSKDKEGIVEVYKVMWGILKLKNIQTIIIIHLIAKIGFQANDAVTNLKLLDKGFSQEDLALTVLIDFPFELALGYYIGKWSSVYPPLQLWMWGFVARLVAAGVCQLTVMMFPTSGVTNWYRLAVIIAYIFSTSMSTIMFVALAAFHAKIADPVIGGTYMTMLATVSNLGGTFPRFFVLKLVDLFTRATCSPPSALPIDLKAGVSPVTASFSCALEADKHRCIEGGGTCSITTDGYYIVNVICITIGVVTFWSYIRPKATMLQTLPLRAWRMAGDR